MGLTQFTILFCIFSILEDRIKKKKIQFQPAHLRPTSKNAATWLSKGQFQRPQLEQNNAAPEMEVTPTLKVFKMSLEDLFKLYIRFSADHELESSFPVSAFRKHEG